MAFTYRWNFKQCRNVRGYDNGLRTNCKPLFQMGLQQAQNTRRLRHSTPRVPSKDDPKTQEKERHG